MEPERRALRRARRRRAVPILVLVVAGAVVLVATGGGSVVANAVAAMLLGIAGVWAVSLVFYEIGLGEDRERAERDRRPPDRPLS